MIDFKSFSHPAIKNLDLIESLYQEKKYKEEARGFLEM